MNDEHFPMILVAIIAISITVAFSVDRCTKAQVEIAKEKANTTRDFNFGVKKQ